MKLRIGSRYKNVYINESHDVTEAIETLLPNKIKKEDILFFCIGSTRVLGDTLAPIIGTRLSKMGFNVMGTLEEPINARNLHKALEGVDTDKFIIAIDAGFAPYSDPIENVGSVIIRNKPIQPGSGVERNLPDIGDISIIGLVEKGLYNSGDNLEILKHTDLAIVMSIADKIVEGVSNIQYKRKKIKRVRDCI